MPSSSDKPSPDKPSFVALLAIPLLCFAFLAPTITTPGNDMSMERIVIGTALETRRDGHWLVPHALGEVRTRKPPLSVWLGALSMRPSTVADLSTTDPDLRARAYRSLMAQARLPFVIASCLIVLATFELARLVHSARLGYIAAAVCATNLLFLGFARRALFDVHLALFVVLTNIFLAHAILHRRRWFGCVGAGLSIGLAMMSKGPVCLIQSILPAVLFVIWRSRAQHLAAPLAGRVQESKDPRWALPILTGILTVLLVGTPWYVLMYAKVPGIVTIWFNEVTRIDPANKVNEPWHAYLGLVPEFAPWSVWFLAGLVLGTIDTIKRSGQPIVFAFFSLVCPLVIMSFFQERLDRYLVPLIPAAAIVTAWALHAHLESWKKPDGMEKVLVVLHWIVVAGATIGIAVAGTIGMKSFRHPDGEPYYSVQVGVIAACTFAAILLVGILSHVRRPVAIVVFTAILGLASHLLFLHGRYGGPRARSGMRDIADAVALNHPDAVLYSQQHDGALHDVAIHTNRIVALRPDPTTIEPGDRPQIIFLRTARDEAPPPPPGDSWQFVATQKRQADAWHAYVLPPR